MAGSKSKDAKNKKKKGGGRRTALVGLLAIGAVIGAWLSNCIPGFGIGADGSAEGEAEQKTEQAEEATPSEPTTPETKQDDAKVEGESQGAAGEEAGAKPEVAAKVPLEITVDARGCILAGEEPRDCAELCKQGELFAGAEKVLIDTTEGPHKIVESFLDCLRTAEIEFLTTRDE